MSDDKDISIFIKNARSFGKSLAGHLPGIGRALGIRDTYQKGKKLTKSTPEAVNAVKRRIKTRARRRIRRALPRR